MATAGHFADIVNLKLNIILLLSSKRYVTKTDLTRFAVKPHARPPLLVPQLLTCAHPEILSESRKFFFYHVLDDHASTYNRQPISGPVQRVSSSISNKVRETQQFSARKGV